MFIKISLNNCSKCADIRNVSYLQKTKNYLINICCYHIIKDNPESLWWDKYRHLLASLLIKLFLFKR